jgi:hypothetical protein
LRAGGEVAVAPAVINGIVGAPRERESAIFPRVLRGTMTCRSRAHCVS